MPSSRRPAYDVGPARIADTNKILVDPYGTNVCKDRTIIWSSPTCPRVFRRIVLDLSLWPYTTPTSAHSARDRRTFYIDRDDSRGTVRRGRATRVTRNDLCRPFANDSTHWLSSEQQPSLVLKFPVWRRIVKTDVIVSGPSFRQIYSRCPKSIRVLCFRIRSEARFHYGRTISPGAFEIRQRVSVRFSRNVSFLRTIHVVDPLETISRMAPSLPVRCFALVRVPLPYKK